MELVSQLCFAEGTPPSKEVIQKLLSYITGHRRSGKEETIVSRELTIFDDSFDPTPVVRSFLLQQLMQTRLVFIILSVSFVLLCKIFVPKSMYEITCVC